MTLAYWRRRGFSLTEMLVVALIIVILTALVTGVLVRMQATGETTECTNRLHQLGIAFTRYFTDYRNELPTFAPPQGLGDKYNWADLWQSSDPGNAYLGTNRTVFPRVPRLLEGYAGNIAVLHCPGQGASAWWYDTGPYHYNATSPYDGIHTLWQPLAELSTANYATQPLAACTRPPQIYDGNGYSWRHGEKKTAGTKGINNHLYASGAVKQLKAPAKWDEPP